MMNGWVYSLETKVWIFIVLYRYFFSVITFSLKFMKFEGFLEYIKKTTWITYITNDKDFN